MHVLLYNQLHPQSIPNFQKMKRFLEAGDFRSADVKKGLDHGIGHIRLVEVDSEEQEVAPPIPKSPQTSNAASDRKIAPPPLSRRAG